MILKFCQHPLFRCHIPHIHLIHRTPHTHLEGHLEVLIHQEEATVVLQVCLLPAQVKVEMLVVVLQVLEAITIATMVIRVAILLIQTMQQQIHLTSHLTLILILRLLLMEKAKVKRGLM
jgi:hypothetical protein